MKSVKMLSISAGIACLAMLSSCSKEEAMVAPAAQNQSVRDDSNMKGVLNTAPYLAPTIGVAGEDSAPAGWEFENDGSVIGTSTFSHMFGSNGMPWDKALPAIPGVTNVNTVITTTADGFKAVSNAKTTIKNLIVGRSYAIDIYASTSRSDSGSSSWFDALYGNIYLQADPASGVWVQKGKVSFPGKSVWVKKTITFVATATEAKLKLDCSVIDIFAYSSVNFLVNQNSIREISIR